jgi:hypothetical protein
VIGEPPEVTVAVRVIGVLYGMLVAEIARTILVAAGAAKAGEAIIVTMARTKIAFA